MDQAAQGLGEAAGAQWDATEAALGAGVALLAEARPELGPEADAGRLFLAEAAGRSLCGQLAAWAAGEGGGPAAAELSVEELQGLLRGRGMPTSGSRAELVARLLEIRW